MTLLFSEGRTLDTPLQLSLGMTMNQFLRVTEELPETVEALLQIRKLTLVALLMKNLI